LLEKSYFDTEHSERCSLSLQQKGKVVDDDDDDASETSSLTGVFSLVWLETPTIGYLSQVQEKSHNHKHNQTTRALVTASPNCVIATPRNGLFGASASSSSEIGERELEELPIVAQADSGGVPGRTDNRNFGQYGASRRRGCTDMFYMISQPT